MPDSASGGLIIYGCPSDQLSALAHELLVHGLISEDGAREDAVQFGAPGYTHRDPLGSRAVGEDFVSGGVITTALAYAVPGATWAAWVDPHHEFCGEIAIHLPGHGVWVGTCEDGGDVLVRADAVEAALVAQDVRKLADVLGTPWRAAVATLGTAPARWVPVPSAVTS